MESISISKCINPQHNDGVWKAPLLRPTRRSAMPPRRPNPLANSPPPKASPAASSRKRSAPSARQETSFGCPAGHSSGPTAWPFNGRSSACAVYRHRLLYHVQKDPYAPSS
ncbi:hypothetical protein DIPPA_26622 [Diplonema papillatum]|nr:hypothetical protein DIPPA_26622 [Diplonema papillatum]